MCLACAHPEIASFGPWRRSRIFKILGIARYTCGFKNARALPGTKIYYFRMGTSVLSIQHLRMDTSMETLFHPHTIPTRFAFHFVDRFSNSRAIFIYQAISNSYAKRE